KTGDRRQAEVRGFSGIFSRLRAIRGRNKAGRWAVLDEKMADFPSRNYLEFSASGAGAKEGRSRARVDWRQLIKISPKDYNLKKRGSPWHKTKKSF
ncbi:MAG TPA: hypothetical protein VNK24_10795, partial [Elusimicrobiota bacterium]|nr:hypothetical protein [Elusimicrobiota bacterium]